MKYRKFILWALIVGHALALPVGLAFMAGAASAHGAVEHILGTVTKIAPASITVAKTAGGSVDVAIATATKFTKDKAAAKVSDLKVGDRVVVHAKEGGGKLVADVVQLGSAAAETKSHTHAAAPAPATKAPATNPAAAKPATR